MNESPDPPDAVLKAFSVWLRRTYFFKLFDPITLFPQHRPLQFRSVRLFLFERLLALVCKS